MDPRTEHHRQPQHDQGGGAGQAAHGHPHVAVEERLQRGTDGGWAVVRVGADGEDETNEGEGDEEGALAPSRQRPAG